MALENELAVLLALRADISDLKLKFGQAQKTAQVSAGKMQDAFKGVALGLGAIGAAFAIFRKGQAMMSGAIASAQRQEIAQRKLESAIGFTSTALLQQASALQSSTTFGDEAIVEAQALVGAFIKEESQIKKLMPVILDFAAAKGIDLRTAADLVTKSIASGTNALSRYGIKVSESKDQGVRLESTIQGLERAFGGMSTAIAQTPSGILEQQKNLLGDMAESLGKELIPWQIEWNKLILETLQGWGWIYTQIKKLLNPLDIAMQRDIEWHQQMRDAAFAEAAQLQRSIDKVKELGEEGSKTVQLEIDGKKEVYKVEDAIAKLEQKRRIALRTAAGEARMTGALIGGPAPGKPPKPTKPPVDPAEAEKAAKELLGRQVAIVNAVLTSYSAELSVAFAQIDAQYAAGSVTVKQYYDTKRALVEEQGKAELAAQEKLIALEEDKAKKTAMIAALDKTRADLAIKNIDLNREQSDSEKALGDQQIKNALEVAAIQSRVGELEIQSYVDKLDAELAALAAKHAEELRMLKEQNASVALIKQAQAAQTQERILTEQRAQVEYMNSSLAAVDDVVGQISSIYSDYYAMVVQEEQQKMNAQISSAKAAGASEEELEALRTSLQTQANARAKKAWEKQKKADLASAIIGTAMAVVNAFQTKPFFPLGLLMGVLAGVAGGVQIAKISRQTYPGMATGGPVTQGTTPTADDVPIMASRGEFVTPARSVDYYGPGVMEAMRRRTIPRELFSGIGTSSARRPSMSAFAEGGMVGAAAAAAGQQGVTVVNFLDGGVMDRYLSSIEGQRAIVNTITRRSYEVRNALGVTT